METHALAKYLASIHKVHLIGIGGSAMSGAAKILHTMGKSVSGSDGKDSTQIQLLRKLFPISIGHHAGNLNLSTQLVVVSAAVAATNPELLAAQNHNIPIVKYANLLGALLHSYYGIAVAGTHGKTTTSGMICHALRQQALAPSFLIGGWIEQLGGNAHLDTGKYFVAEACEYDRSFHHLLPQIGVITNVEGDHFDYYRNFAELEAAFAQFAQLVKPAGLLILGRKTPARLPNTLSSQVAVFGRDFGFQSIQAQGGFYQFVLHGEGLPGELEIQLRVPGRFNAENAALAARTLAALGLTAQQISSSLSSYLGARRRFTVLGEREGVTVVDDYAHHPTEIAAVLQTLREVYAGRRILAVFQPHQASRTRHFFQEFCQVLQQADLIVLADIFRARDSEEDWRAVSSEQLCAELCRQGGKAAHYAHFDSLLTAVEQTVRAGDVVVTLGAGNIDEIAHRFLQRSHIGYSGERRTQGFLHTQDRG